MNATGWPVALVFVVASIRCATAGQAAPSAASPPIVSLRDTGYLLGDLIDERVEVELPPGFALDPDSLPLPGRAAPWLEVRRARSEESAAAGTAVIVVTYQIFAEVEQAERVPLPTFKLRLRGGDAARVVEVPEKTFLLSPALPASLADEDRELKPSPMPLALPARATIAACAASTLVALASALFLLWLYDRIPFLPRAPGPFARAWRRWRGRARRPLADGDGKALLRDWHGALNAAAGETLYAATLPRVFERAPHLAPIRADVERLFGDSWRYFYGDDAAPAPDAVLRVLRAAAERERGVPC